MERDGKLLGLRRPQYGLLAVLMAAVIALLLTSVLSVVAHDGELQGLYSEEGDGTAMTFVQRESFGVIIELDRWAFGDATTRDVQIARALLGQRLQVRTASGATTYELTDAPYRASLEALDEVVRDLGSVVGADQLAHRSEIDDVVQAFEVRTHELSTVFQEITRERAAEAISLRAMTEQTQAVLAGVIILLGAGLAGWIAADLRATYRRASARLQDETRRLEHARLRLEFRQGLETRARAWSDAVVSGVATPQIVDRALADLADLAPGLVVTTVVSDTGERRVMLVDAPAAETDADTADVLHGTIDDDDARSALDRINETLQLAHTRDRSEQALDQARRFDGLTGLPNRERLQPAVAEALARAGRLRSASVVAIALVDINRFADFNSSFGHAEGDRLLVEVARVLADRCPPTGDLLRLSADEFALVMAHRSAAEAERSIDALAEALRLRHEVAGEQVAVSVTIGAVVDGDRTVTPDALLQRAAVALAAAQASEPRPAVHYFSWESDHHLLEVMREESALRSALRSGEFVTHFQPIVTLGSGALTACEALVRWERPGVGTVGPMAFLPAIARAGLVVELGWQIIDTALTLWGAARARSGGALDDVSLSINLDAAQLAEPALADYLLNAAERAGVPTERLVVEVTEHALLVGDAAVAQLEQLRARGVRVALDDFGTGYSSLAQASSLPLDVLKLDRSFLPDPRLDEQQGSIIRDIVSIAGTLGLAVTAEGIETEEVAGQLREIGVQYGQGWWFAKAMAMDDLERWMDAPSATPSVVG